MLKANDQTSDLSNKVGSQSRSMGTGCEATSLNAEVNRNECQGENIKGDGGQCGLKALTFWLIGVKLMPGLGPDRIRCVP